MLNLEKFTEIVRVANDINMLDNDIFVFISLDSHVNQVDIYAHPYPNKLGGRLINRQFYYHGNLGVDEDDKVYDEIITELNDLWTLLNTKLKKLAQINKLQEELEALG